MTIGFIAGQEQKLRKEREGKGEVEEEEEKSGRLSDQWINDSSRLMR